MTDAGKAVERDWALIYRGAKGLRVRFCVDEGQARDMVRDPRWRRWLVASRPVGEWDIEEGAPDADA